MLTISIITTCGLVLMLAGHYLMFWADIIAKTTGYGIAVWVMPSVTGALLGLFFSTIFRRFGISNEMSHFFFILGYGFLAILPGIYFLLIMSLGKR